MQGRGFYFFLFFIFSFFFYYSYVHTRLGLFLPPAPTPSLTTHSTPSGKGVLDPCFLEDLGFNFQGMIQANLSTSSSWINSCEIAFSRLVDLGSKVLICQAAPTASIQEERTHCSWCFITTKPLRNPPRGLSKAAGGGKKEYKIRVSLCREL
jgi:hypothetical protein